MGRDREGAAITGIVNAQFTLGTGAATLVVPDDDAIDWWAIQNQGDTTVRWLSVDAPTTSDGFMLAPGDTVNNIPGGEFTTPARASIKGAVRAIAVTGTPLVQVAYGE